MKTAFSLVSILALITGASAFVPRSPLVVVRPSTTAVRAEAANRDDPELVAAIAEVRACASEFSDETVHFANVWINNMLEGKMEGTAAGLLDECVLDDSEKCQRYSQALANLDSLLGVGMNEQF